MVCWTVNTNDFKFKSGVPVEKGSTKEELSLVNGANLKDIISYS
jgi:hypothetical protein